MTYTMFMSTTHCLTPSPFVVLLILDGWGIAPPGPGNALSLAKLPHFTQLKATYPHTQLDASGTAVGLPRNEDGNTETGHLNLGAGRIIYQDLPRINMSIADGSFSQNAALLGAFAHARQKNSNVHILGLLSDGSVHANKEHLFALADLAASEGTQGSVFFHIITDGRDSSPNAGIRLILDMEDKLKGTGIRIGSVMGRYYAMDRDRRWERTAKAYDALTTVTAPTGQTAAAIIQEAYNHGITDEFIIPTSITNDQGQVYPRIRSGDAVIFANFRIDRPRQLTRAFVLPDFEHHQRKSFDPYAVDYYHKHIVEEDSRLQPFTRQVVLSDLYFVTMTEYERDLPVAIAYPPVAIHNPLGEVLAQHGLAQLRIAETEKERFVTYYFNGLREEPFTGEDRVIVPSKKVATYDLAPEMSVKEITEVLLSNIAAKKYQSIVVNIANPDMVAHTGNIAQSVIAVEAVDECLEKITKTIVELGGTCLITADHGNVEEMLGPDGEMDTEHSTYPVPFILVDARWQGKNLPLPTGKLGDVAPTILTLLGKPIPPEMTGKNLVEDSL